MERAFEDESARTRTDQTHEQDSAAEQTFQSQPNLTGLDTGSRIRAANHLQRSVGNNAVQRVASARVQRQPDAGTGAKKAETSRAPSEVTVAIKAEKQGDIGPITGAQYEWGVSKPTEEGKAAGRQKPKDLKITKEVDEFTPLLYQASEANEQMEVNVVLTRENAAGEKENFFTYQFKGAIIKEITSKGDLEVLEIRFSDWSMTGPKGRTTDGGRNSEDRPRNDKIPPTPAPPAEETSDS